MATIYSTNVRPPVIYDLNYWNQRMIVKHRAHCIQWDRLQIQVLELCTLTMRTFEIFMHNNNEEVSLQANIRRHLFYLLVKFFSDAKVLTFLSNSSPKSFFTMPIFFSKLADKVIQQKQECLSVEGPPPTCQ